MRYTHLRRENRMRSVGCFLRELVKHYIFFRSPKYSFQELMYYYALGVTFLLAFFSSFVNNLIGLPISLIIHTYIALPVLIGLFWLSKFKKRFKLSKNIYLIFVFLSINLIWFSTWGSAGSSLIILQAFLFMLLFFSSKKQLSWILPILFINILVLFSFELFFSDTLGRYNTNFDRSLDVFIATMVFFMFEIPVLLFAKGSLEKDRENAIQSEKSKTSYIVNLSHEIRTPMNAILGFSELLDTDSVEENERKQFVQIINQNGRTLLNLLNNVINMSSIDSGERMVSISKFFPGEVLMQVEDVLKQQVANNNKLDLRVVLPQKEVEVESDSTMLYQILINLGYNSIKFTPDGYIHIGYFTQDDNLIFYVRDTGAGMDNKVSDRLFERYQKDKNSSFQNNPQGAGLGLAICKGLTDLLKGEIWIDSELNKGSTFYFKLPVKFY